MDDDQQFCLRWNNHQSTLISVFDTLLENETLVDCTLAAEGKFLKAHKVVLSACSPYFATLLSEQYDKHPIFILKDVKYQELRAMMDYMYRGEVNISQDQLAALLKAAESLQIKGLSDNRTGSGSSSSGLGGVVSQQQQQQQQQQKSSAEQHKHISVPGKLLTGASAVAGGYTLEQTKRARIGPSSIDSQDLSGSREGSSSPTARRRKKVRRRSIDNVLGDNHDNSNSSQIQAGTSSIVPTTNATGAIAAMVPVVGGGSGVGQTSTIAAANIPTSSALLAGSASAANIITANVTKKTESVKMGNTDAMNTAAAIAEHIQDENAADSADKDMMIKEKQNHKRSKQQQHHHDGGSSAGKDSDIVIEPKSEYDEEGNDETVEDLTLDDEEMGLEDLDQNAGPSHGGEGSSQGYAQWQVDRSQDEVFLAAQEAQQRDPQGEPGGGSMDMHRPARSQSMRHKSSPYSSPVMLMKYESKKEEDDFDPGLGGSGMVGGSSIDDTDEPDTNDDDDNEQPCDLRLRSTEHTSIEKLISIVAQKQQQQQQQQHASQSSLLSSAGGIESLHPSSLSVLTGGTSSVLGAAGTSASSFATGLVSAIAAVSSSTSNLPVSGAVVAGTLGLQQQAQQQQQQQTKLQPFQSVVAAHLPSALLGYSTIKRSGSFSSQPGAAAGAGSTASAVGMGGIGAGSSSSSTAAVAAALSVPSGSGGVIGGNNLSSFIGVSGGSTIPSSSSNSATSGSCAIGTSTAGTSATGSGTSGTTWGGAYTCERCGNSYARPHSLNRHVRFECGVEPKFECPICHKKSKHKHNLVLHMRTHQNR